MKGFERRGIEDDATGAALVDLAPACSGERFLLHGDVIVLSSDFFLAEPEPGPAGIAGGGDGMALWGLFDLAPVTRRPGHPARHPRRDPCALKVMAVDEGVADALFDAGGEFAECAFSPPPRPPTSSGGCGTGLWPWPRPTPTTSSTATALRETRPPHAGAARGRPSGRGSGRLPRRGGGRVRSPGRYRRGRSER